MSYKFGKRSLESLETCHKDLQVIHKGFIKVTRIDYGIHCGGRTYEEQMKEYVEGDSTLNPRTHPEKCKHMIWEGQSKSKATDLHIADSRYTWDSTRLCYLQMELEKFANELYKDGLITHRLNWIGKYYLMGMTNFKDFPHTELIPVMDI